MCPRPICPRNFFLGSYSPCIIHLSFMHQAGQSIPVCLSMFVKISLIFQRNIVHRSQIVRRPPILTIILRFMCCMRWGVYTCSCWPRRPKARALALHGGPLGWLKESDPLILCDGRSMPPALMDHTTCPSLGLIYYWVYTNHRHELRHARKVWPVTLVNPCLLSDANITLE